MNTNAKILQEAPSADENVVDGRPFLGDVLIISGDESAVVSMESILNDNLYGTSVASNGDQIIERLKKTWYNIILIDLDSIDVSEDYLARKIRIMEPDIPIIGLGNHTKGRCLDITYLKKPLSLELIEKYFLKVFYEKEIKGGRKALNGVLLGICTGLLLWLLLI